MDLPTLERRVESLTELVNSAYSPQSHQFTRNIMERVKNFDSQNEEVLKSIKQYNSMIMLSYFFILVGALFVLYSIFLQRRHVNASIAQVIQRMTTIEEGIHQKVEPALFDKTPVIIKSCPLPARE